jgi:hypothetical protein
MGVTHVTTSPYHPQTNGACERVNSTLVVYIRAFCEMDAEHWYKYLGAAIYAYNTAYQTSLAATPYFLMFGRDPVDSCDLLFEEMCDLRDEEPKVTVSEWSHRLEVARHVAQTHLVAAQDKMAEAANVNRKHGNEIAVGSWVYLRPTLERQPKLATFGAGLFCVERRNGNYLELVDLEGAKRQASISDVVLIRQPPPGHVIMDPYQRVRALLHKSVTLGESAPFSIAPMEIEHDDDTEVDTPTVLDESYDPFEVEGSRTRIAVVPKGKEELLPWEFSDKDTGVSDEFPKDVQKDSDTAEEAFEIERILKHSIDKGVMRLKCAVLGLGPRMTCGMMKGVC